MATRESTNFESFQRWKVLGKVPQPNSAHGHFPSVAVGVERDENLLAHVADLRQFFVERLRFHQIAEVRLKRMLAALLGLPRA